MGANAYLRLGRMTGENGFALSMTSFFSANPAHKTKFIATIVHVGDSDFAPTEAAQGQIQDGCKTSEREKRTDRNEG